MRFLGDFVNFTGANSYFLSHEHNCKLPLEVKNRDQAPLAHHSKTQMRCCFQSRILRW